MVYNVYNVLEEYSIRTISSFLIDTSFYVRLAVKALKHLRLGDMIFLESREKHYYSSAGRTLPTT